MINKKLDYLKIGDTIEVVITRNEYKNNAEGKIEKHETKRLVSGKIINYNLANYYMSHDEYVRLWVIEEKDGKHIIVYDEDLEELARE